MLKMAVEKNFAQNLVVRKFNSKDQLSKVAGVNWRSVVKFINGEPITPSTFKRIEKVLCAKIPDEYVTICDT